MHWIILAIAGIFEVLMTTTLKMSENFSNLWYSIGFFITGTISFVLLSQAMKVIPVGTAYAVWTGIGALGTAIIGIIFFRESTDFWRLFFLFLLIVSIVGLKVVSAE
jgi:quaternary ammonium compound-resistance protein SugE